MNKLFFFFFFCTLTVFAQTNAEIAGIYLTKSEEELANKNLNQSVEYFEKAKTLFEGKTTIKVEEQGTFLYFALQNYIQAKEHAKNYFALNPDKKTDRYKEVLFLYVELEELIEKQKEIEKQQNIERLLAIAKQRKLDSLKTTWKNLAAKMVVEADSIFAFDKNGIAVFKNSKGKYGLIDDKGNEIVTATYNNSCSFDAIVLLFEGIKDQPTKITAFNTNTKELKTLPAISQFNALSTHYGKVMLPRSNNVLICYPNNTNKVAIYDLTTNSLKPSTDLERYFEHWKDLDVIKKYNKENQVKLDKDYLDYGGNLVGFSVLCSLTGGIEAFITIGGTLISPDTYKYIGTLESGFAEAIKKDGSREWIDENGNVTTMLSNKSGIYEGTTVLNKVGKSQFELRNKENQIIKGDKVLDNLADFLSKQK